MVQILSFDIGIKNMAYCFIKANNNLELLNLNKEHFILHHPHYSNCLFNAAEPTFK